ncbi:MAG: hypothetical protein OXC81_04810, partial [Betaproteobacteria bacterium]|nr:hypothetical protein [Betaproteobacteria bacterium]
MGKKFFGEEKKKLRSKLWSGEWRMKFVHGNLKDDDARELDLMRENGIEVITVAKVIEELKDPKFGAGLKTAGIATNMT